jgi:hypothetical protein
VDTKQVPPNRPAAHRNRSSANHRVQGEKNAKNGAIRNSDALFALFLLRFCMLALLCMLSRWTKGNLRVCGAWKSCFEAS